MPNSAWFQKLMFKFKDDPEFLREYIIILEEEIVCLNKIIEQQNAGSEIIKEGEGKK